MDPRTAPATLALLLVAAAPAAAQELDPQAMLPDPCGLEGFCEGVSEAYHATHNLLSSGGAGASDLVAAALAAQPNPGAVWSYPDAAAKLVPGPEDVQGFAEANGAPAPAVPGPSLYLGMPGVAFFALPAPEEELERARRDAQAHAAAAPTDDALALAAGARAALPLEATADVARLVAELGTLEAQVLFPAAPATPGPAEPLAPPPPHGLGARGSSALAGPGHARVGGLGLAPAPALAAPDRAAPWVGAQGVAARLLEAAGLLVGPLFLAEVPIVPALFLGLLLLLPPLYSRLRRDQVLDHALRLRLVEVVQAKPGITIEELAREAGATRSTARYHLHLLVKHGHLTALGGAKTTHYYACDGRHDREDRERRALLASPRAREVAQAIVANPGIGRRALAAAVGIGPSTVTWHLQRFQGLGLVEDRPAPEGLGVFAAPALAEMLRPWSDVPPVTLEPPAPSPGQAAVAAGPLVVAA